jgi:hypothetical protein
MSAAQATLPPPSTALRLLEARVLPEFGAFWLMRPWLTNGSGLCRCARRQLTERSPPKHRKASPGRGIYRASRRAYVAA